MADLDRPVLIESLKASLGAVANQFNAANDGDFERHIDLGALRLVEKRPRTVLGSFTAVAGTASYSSVPADLVSLGRVLWGVSDRAVWDLPSVPPPRLQLVGSGSTRTFSLSPAPTQTQITLFGATVEFHYSAMHIVDQSAANTTVEAADRGLFLLACQLEAMKELQLRQATKPAQSNATRQSGRDGVGTLLDSLRREWRQAR